MSSSPDDPTDREREVPEGKSRKQILCHKQVRAYLRERSDANSNTYSQQLAEWLPDDVAAAPVHEVTDDDIVHIKATPQVHSDVMELVGKRVKPGQVIAYYALLDAVRQGRFEEANAIARTIPDRLWDVLHQLNGSDIIDNPDEAHQ